MVLAAQAASSGEHCRRTWALARNISVFDIAISIGLKKGADMAAETQAAKSIRIP